MTTKSYSTAANARRALSKIGKAALCKSKELIKEVDGQYQFNLEAAEAIQNAYECDDNCACEPKATVVEEDHSKYVYAYSVHGLSNCPHCGVYLDNGVGIHRDEVNGTWVTHTKEREFWCMGCGGEFGPLLPNKKAKGIGAPHPEMKSSLKLDRTITCIETGEVWKNAYQMWKEHQDWMTTGQQDRLTAQLYKSAKAGNSTTVFVNGRSFRLVNA